VFYLMVHVATEDERSRLGAALAKAALPARGGARPARPWARITLVGALVGKRTTLLVNGRP
jgi:hypothetical protein